MSTAQIAIHHNFCTGQPGLAVVSIEIDGVVTLLLPETADQMAAALAKHARLAREVEAAAKAQGLERLASTPSQGVA